MNPNQPTELQKAIGHLDHCRGPLQTCSICVSSLEKIKASAKQLQQAEKERDNYKQQFESCSSAIHLLQFGKYGTLELTKERDKLKAKLDEWSNKELLGETERCQFEALKVQNAQLKDAVRECVAKLTEIKCHDLRAKHDPDDCFVCELANKAINHPSVQAILKEKP